MKQICCCMLPTLLLACAIGCDPRAPAPAAESESNAAVADAPTPDGNGSPAATESGETAEVPDDQLITLASWEEVQQRIADSDVPVVLDVWSTSCIPCMQEFPGLVKLEAQYEDDQLRCISFCVDYIGLKNKTPETYIPKAAEFLRGVDARDVQNYLSETPDTDVFSELDVPSLPAVLVFGADGKLKKKFVDVGDTAGFTYESAVVPYVAELVGEPKE